MKIYLKVTLSLALILFLGMIVIPTLLSQKDTLFVLAGFVVAVMMLPLGVLLNRWSFPRGE